MNKKELIVAVAEKAGISKKESEACVKAFIDVVIEAVAKKEKVQLVGFGTFEARDRAARSGRNPATGGAIKIPAATVPAFKAGKAFKETVNPKKVAKTGGKTTKKGKK